MKRVLFAVLMLLAGLAFAPATPAAAQKVGFVRSQRILTSLPAIDSVRKTLDAEAGRYRAQLDTLETAITKLNEDLSRQQATLSADAKTQRQQAIQTQFAAYQQRAGQVQETMTRREAELMQPVMKRIGDVIEAIRKEGSYAMIFDASAQGVIVTADSTLDLTDQVLRRLGVTPTAGQ